MSLKYENDPRIVMTLDAGGTNFKFSAVQGNKLLLPAFSVPSYAFDLDRSLDAIVGGFERLRQSLPAEPVAISFTFPGPTDYAHGIVVAPNNLPAYRDVALAAMLEEQFQLPVFINNDGDLFTYGEAIAGFLPYVNRLLEEAGSPKRYRNLFGITLGTGFGGGIVSNGELLGGDNICAGEIWLMRNKLQPETNAEEGASIRAVRRVYAALAGLPLDRVPEPKGIFEIGMGQAPGNQAAAREAFRQLGEVVGDALAQALTLVDGLAVIGGGISGAWPLFLPAVVDEMNSFYRTPDGGTLRRLTQFAFNLEDPEQRKVFLKGDRKEITVPRSTRKVAYDPMPRTGVGITRLGTSEAVAIGAYAYALHQLDP